MPGGLHGLLSRLPRPARRLVYSPARVARGAWDDFVEWFNGLDLSENAVLLAFAVVVGAAGALGVVAFYKLIDLAYLLLFRWPARWLPAESPWVVRPVVTGFTLLAAWWIMARFAPGEEGMTVADVQRRVVRAGGRVPLRPAMVRTTAAAATLGGGGSVGSEGPVAVLGAAAGSFIAKAFRFAADRTTLLVAAGTAAAISAAFNAPLAGAFFALEEILVGLNVAAFPVVVVASVVAAVISRAVFGNHPAFPIPEEYSYRHVAEVVVSYPLLGVVIGVMAAFFIRMVARLAPAEVRPGRALMGGALVGLMVAASGGLLVGTGHLAIPIDVFGTMAWWSIGLLAIGKVIATAMTLGWGGSGGVFTPALYIGAATGGAFGAALAAVMPASAIQPAAYGVVGMGAMVGAATGAPITGILMVFEMTDDYALMLPLMMATAIALVIARRLEPDDLYRGWLRRRGVHLEHGIDRDALSGLTVADALTRDIVVVQEDEPMEALHRRFAFADQTVFPVVDPTRRLVGLLTHRELADSAGSTDAHGTPRLARDAARSTEAVTLDLPLSDVARRLGALGVAALPVVDAPSGRVLGTIGRDAILSRYGRALAGRSG